MIRIGTRGSRLALWQAEDLKNRLDKEGEQSELHIIKTRGDQIQHLSLSKMEGKGFFTKEIEDSLLNAEVDIAVHSMKDLPTEKIPGLVIAGVSEREDPADLLIIRKEKYNPEFTLGLSAAALVGTSSVRRKVQIREFLPSCELRDIRGNVPTRLRKLNDGTFDAIILAAAGVRRLEIDLGGFHVVRFNPIEFIPAPAQGVIAYQCREDDLVTRKLLGRINHEETARVTNVERKILKLVEGGCHVPLGAYCYRDNENNFHCTASYAQNENDEPFRYNLSQSTSDQLAERIVENLVRS